jgi:DNA invertase Pin-like site-specific DNA recombinase
MTANDCMIYGHARVSTDGQSVEAQIAALTAAGADKIFREVAKRSPGRPPRVWY